MRVCQVGACVCMYVYLYVVCVSTCQHTQPLILHTQPLIPHTQSLIPHTQSLIPHTQPLIPHTQSLIPLTQSLIRSARPKSPSCRGPCQAPHAIRGMERGCLSGWRARCGRRGRGGAAHRTTSRPGDYLGSEAWGFCAGECSGTLQVSSMRRCAGQVRGAEGSGVREVRRLQDCLVSFHS